MISSVIVSVHNNGISAGRQSSKKSKKRLFFFKTCVAPAIDTKAHHPAFFQNTQPLLHSFHTGRGAGGNAVISSRKISEIKADHIRALRPGIPFHMLMAVQDQSGPAVYSMFFQQFPCRLQGFFLNIKGKHLPFISCHLTEKKRIVAISHGGIYIQSSPGSTGLHHRLAPVSDPGQILLFHTFHDPFHSFRT